MCLKIYFKSMGILLGVVYFQEKNSWSKRDISISYFIIIIIIIHLTCWFHLECIAQLPRLF